MNEEKAQVGFSNEMGALYISKRGQNGGKSYELKIRFYFLEIETNKNMAF